MGLISPLPQSLINKIAAGEVIERPASVVKELLENAIDAGTAHLDIAVEDGGKRLVRVTDDGAGMAADELPLAVAPHATSKLSDEEQLYAIATMGFRGEALASIAEVSQLTLTSRPADRPEGARIQVAAGKCQPVQIVGCPAGTTIEVHNLFYNVPARRKFLRGAGTEMGHISEQVTRIALVHAELGLAVQHNGRQTQQLPALQGRLDRIAALYGPELAESLIPISQDERGVRISGWVGRPQQSRATGRWQYFFVNGRYIRDRFVGHAVREAYRGLSDPSRFPPIFLFIRVDPAAVDVNVHPTKIELRWGDSNLIHSQTLSAIRHALRRTDLTPALRTDQGTTGPAEPDCASGRQKRVRQAITDFLKRQPSAQRRMDFGSARPSSSGAAPKAPPTGGGALFEPIEQPSSASPTAGGAAVGRTSETTGPPSDALRDARPNPKVVQLHNSYLVAETDDGIVIIDQHALHERVLYEQLRRRLVDGTLQSQRLLLPEPVAATPGQMAAVQTNADLLARLGIEIAPFGPDSVAVQAFPGLLGNLDVAEFTRDLLDQLAESQTQSGGEALLEKIIQLMACKAAVKAGQVLQTDEIKALLVQRELVELSSSCPHGRPTSLRLTRQQLDRQFKRT
jgi:DNA mismatch repair protein MutL